MGVWGGGAGGRGLRISQGNPAWDQGTWRGRVGSWGEGGEGALGFGTHCQTATWRGRGEQQILEGSIILE